MTTSWEDSSGTMPVRVGFALDLVALDGWMASHVSGYAGPLTIEQFKGGQSNPTYKLNTPGRSYVLRRKPSGPILKGAHAVDREARVLSALGGLGFPVARVYGLCMDDSVIGSWFFVMEMVEGRNFWSATFPGVPREERPLYFEAMNETIARLHRIDIEKAGLADFGNPGNYFARQISRWSRQYLEDTDAGRDPHMDQLIDWLPGAIPADRGEASIIHGDFRCDNMIFHPSEPRVMAVLDWELATLGHPLADFAYHATMFRMPPHIVAGLVGADLKALNIPSEEEYVAAYCRRTGRQCIPDYNFYIAFNLFRIAAMVHGIKGRTIRGTAAGGKAIQLITILPELGQLAWQQAILAGA
ncbi:MAG: phosphotransferase family protein [Dehalococcoidia bacterium]